MIWHQVGLVAFWIRMCCEYMQGVVREVVYALRDPFCSRTTVAGVASSGSLCRVQNVRLYFGMLSSVRSQANQIKSTWLTYAQISHIHLAGGCAPKTESFGLIVPRAVNATCLQCSPLLVMQINLLNFLSLISRFLFSF